MKVRRGMASLPVLDRWVSPCRSLELGAINTNVCLESMTRQASDRQHAGPALDCVGRTAAGRCKVEFQSIA